MGGSKSKLSRESPSEELRDLAVRPATEESVNKPMQSEGFLNPEDPRIKDAFYSAIIMEGIGSFFLALLASCATSLIAIKQRDDQRFELFLPQICWGMAYCVAYLVAGPISGQSVPPSSTPIDNI